MDHRSCSGCSLCLLVCPVWRETRDVRLTPRGRAKAIQHGASAADIARSVAACTLCGACEPACPEELPLVDLMIALRRQTPLAVAKRNDSGTRSLLLAGRALGQDEPRRQRILALLGAEFELAADDGSDIALALETGAALPEERLDRFLHALRAAKRLVVAEGILVRPLRRRLPRVRVTGLGEALTGTGLAAKLRSGDLYVIESRAFNGDRERLVGHYDRLRAASGCEMNLDLQRIAIPACGPGANSQARWILEGRKVKRIVVEDLGDGEAFAFSGHPVVHLADL